MPADAERHFSILSWGLDDLVTVRAGVLLGKRYQVQSLTYSRAPFAERAAVSAFAVKNLLSSRDRNSRIVDLVRTEVAPQGLDLYVVVTKGEASYGSRNRTVTGIGAIDR
ncbi:MAG TPA: hypothetical protein VFL62_13910, partial [Bradyrhizobium sp.]|nr:hypothetical protein [Bradyrhizobium sp.]